MDSETLMFYVRSRSPRVRQASAGEMAPAMHLEIREDDGRVTGVLKVRTPAGDVGQREVRAADCASVAAGVALIVALIMDEDLARGKPARPDLVEGPSSPPPSSTQNKIRVADPRPKQELDSAVAAPVHRVAVGAALQVMNGLGPDVGVVPRVFVDAELPGLARRATFRISLGEALARSTRTPLGTATFGATDLRIEPCATVIRTSHFQGRSCGVFEVLTLRGEGTQDVAAPQSGSHTTLDLGLALRASWVLSSRIDIGLSAGVTVPTARYRFYFSPDVTVYRLAAWSAFAEASLGMRFW